ncbi:unnamed protein product [Clonostachys rhizophaga]|uniref:Uncharacterized protein n=1 Tax=Clonostachys rhizophaga TaxID=160324 RepID=A0A9N9VKT4_9HYPO|nr:unnamed protein product [Clonostachys rhizophaga]
MEPDGPLISGRDFCPDSDIGSKLIQYADLHTDPCTGFTLLFPLKSYGEEGVGGKIHQSHAPLADDFELKVKLPRGHFTFAVQEAMLFPTSASECPTRSPILAPSMSAATSRSHISELLELWVCIEPALKLGQRSVVIQLDLVVGRGAKDDACMVHI